MCPASGKRQLVCLRLDYHKLTPHQKKHARYPTAHQIQSSTYLPSSMANPQPTDPELTESVGDVHIARYNAIMALGEISEFDEQFVLDVCPTFTLFAESVQLLTPVYS